MNIPIAPILVSVHLYAALGAAALFLAESILLGLALSGGRKAPAARVSARQNAR